MATKGALPIWVCAKMAQFQVGGSDLGARTCGFALNLSAKGDSERPRKWECLSVGVLAQRAITPVEDEKPQTSGLESSGAIERTQQEEAKVFHKDLNLLPSE